MSGTRIALLSAAAVLVFWMVGAYNRLVALRSAIGAAWAQVDQQLQRRHAFLQQLVSGLRPHLVNDASALAALEGALLQVQAAAERVRARPVAAPLVAVLVKAEDVLAMAQARVVALLEHHPALRDDSPEVAQPLAALHELESRLTFARQLFNEAAQSYNDAARQFPTRLLTRLYGFGTAGRV